MGGVQPYRNEEAADIASNRNGVEKAERTGESRNMEVVPKTMQTGRKACGVIRTTRRFGQNEWSSFDLIVGFARMVPFGSPRRALPAALNAEHQPHSGWRRISVMRPSSLFQPRATSVQRHAPGSPSIS
jgi:hypothetical protein